jgi:hypothetical protein
MSIVSVITDPTVVDRILRHLRAGGGHNRFEFPGAACGLDDPPRSTIA